MRVPPDKQARRLEKTPSQADPGKAPGSPSTTENTCARKGFPGNAPLVDAATRPLAPWSKSDASRNTCVLRGSWA